MKLATGFGFALIMLAALAAPLSARAEGLPQGSYLDTCNDARVQGMSLVAHCRDSAGIERSSALINYNRCVGDITNTDGVLTCNFGVAGPVPLITRERAAITRVAVDCIELHREASVLRAQMDRTADPIDRARLQGQLDLVHDQADRCTQ